MSCSQLIRKRFIIKQLKERIASYGTDDRAACRWAARTFLRDIQEADVSSISVEVYKRWGTAMQEDKEKS